MTPREAPVVGKAYDLCLWLLPHIAKFPRSHRFILGDHLERHALSVLLFLVRAAYSREKSEILAEANRRIEELRFLLRLSKDLKLLSVSQHGFAAERLEEIGRMVGGWMRSDKARGARR